MKLKDLKPNPTNPRIVKDEKFNKLVKSILNFPQMLEKRPMVVDADNIVWGGNMRLKALQHIQKNNPDFANEFMPNGVLSEGWVSSAAGWTEEQKREFAIKDNVSIGEWDWDLLANDWDEKDLGDWGVDLPSFEDVEELQVIEDDFDTTPPELPKTILGDLYEIGEHRLLCGDSTDSDQVAKLMNREKADMVFTDPPYNASFNGRSGKFDVIENDDLSKDDFLTFINEFINTLELFKCTEMYICCDWRMYLNVGNLFNHNQLIVWNKDIPCMGKGYRNKHEFIMYSGELKSTTETNVWEEVAIQSGASKDDSGNGWFQGGNKQLRIYPTQKPISIPSRAIANSSKEENLVLDLFLGSGSTMVASHQLNRKCYGMELDPKYCDVIVKRMLKLDPNLTIKRNGVDCKADFLENTSEPIF